MVIKPEGGGGKALMAWPLVNCKLSMRLEDNLNFFELPLTFLSCPLN